MAKKKSAKKSAKSAKSKKKTVKKLEWKQPWSKYKKQNVKSFGLATCLIVLAHEAETALEEFSNLVNDDPAAAKRALQADEQLNKGGMEVLDPRMWREVYGMLTEALDGVK